MFQLNEKGKNTDNKKLQVLILNKSKNIHLITGTCISALFFIIYVITASVTQKADYYSYFFNNIITNIPLTFISILHIGTLGTGFLLIIIGINNIKINISCLNDRFIINIPFQNVKIIRFDEIKNVETKIIYNKELFFIKLLYNKEFRIYFNNTNYNFYLYYLIDGYYDNIEYENKNEKDILKRCYTSRNQLMQVLKIFGNDKIYLPEEYLK